MEPHTDTSKSLSPDERIAWLRLIRSERIGPRTFWNLLQRYHTASKVLDILSFSDRKHGRERKIPHEDDIKKEISKLSNNNLHLIAACEPEYPETLRAIDDAPPFIILQGSPDCLQKPMIAIVGSRNASAAGLSFTNRLAKELGEAGFVVVSGFARGIDTSAHQASIKTGTVAVLAGGHHRIYPSENVPLIKSITQNGGALISEMPLNWDPRGQDFPRRNRIISGLCYGVVIIEGALRSGSMITARFALEQGREVCACSRFPFRSTLRRPKHTDTGRCFTLHVFRTYLVCH